MAAPGTYLTVRDVADSLGLSKPDPVLAWIKAGELKAVNIATSRAGRPTWRISADELERFLAAREAVPAPKAGRRPRRKRPSVKSYF